MPPHFNDTESAAQRSLREKIAQLIFVRIGSNLPPVRTVEQDEERVAQLLTQCSVGGLLLFNGGENTDSTLERLQKISNSPLLVASDVERGVGQQVRGKTLFPHAMAFNKLGSQAPVDVAGFARCVAQECREVGIHITFAPVADVNTNRKNPIIATRAFGEETLRVAELTRAFVAAAEAAGLCTTAKHFPGHGDTFLDSHDSLPSVERSLAELQAREFVPFQAAIEAGCSLVMTAHVAYPALDPSGTPATLSGPILHNVLRKKLNFRGVICSDSLLMAGVRERCANESEMALATLNAGVDLLLDLEEPLSVVNFLCDCVADGRLDIGVVETAYERVLSLKQRVFAPAGRQFAASESASNDAPRLAQRIARDSIEVLQTSGAGPALPLDPAKPLGAILLKPFETSIEPPEQPLAAALRELFRKAQYVQLGPKSEAAAYESAHKLVQSAPQLVIAIIVRPAAWHAFGLRPPQREFVEQAIRAREDAVLISLGVPYVLQEFPPARIRICTYSDVAVSQQAVAALLLR
jgi:beta-glucosidase-like glycosyl hydrolase